MSDRRGQIPIAIGRRKRAVAAAFAVLTLAVGASELLASGAQAAGAPAVVVSPLTGTPDADPKTQISFLGSPVASLSKIVVRGSRSGLHSGRLLSYSTNNGGSFVPAKPFVPGEHVTVYATVTTAGIAASVGTSFTVSTPYVLPPPKPAKPIPTTPTNVMRFHSRHDLVPPAVTVTTPAADPALGDIFISPDSGPGQAGPMIVGPTGTLLWFDGLPAPMKAFNLDVQSYLGQPVLTWWQGQVVEGHGQGADVIESTHYTPLATVHAGNGLYADLHDFEITPQGTAWLTAFAPQHWDLSSVGGPRQGLIDDGVVQEVDIKTGLVMFQWDALGHVPLSDTHSHISGSRSTVLDFFHVNSIDPTPTGELLISARNTWTVYMVSPATGAVEWELGGKETSFTLGTGATFAWQHDAQLRGDGTISLFDNEAVPAESTQSRGLDIALDFSAHTATLVRELSYPGHGILSYSQGDVQLLSNGDDLIGWGQPGAVSEFAPTGPITFDMQLAAPTSTYRAFRYPWQAEPLTQPALVAAPPQNGRTQLYASWNGATDVASWRVLAGGASTKLGLVAVYPSQGFETAISAPTSAAYVRIQALSASGALLRTSRVVRTAPLPPPSQRVSPKSARAA